MTPRILMVSRITLAHGVKGGMEVALHALAEDLVARGCRVSMLTTQCPGLVGHPSTRVFEQIWQVPTRRPGRYSLAWWIRTFKHQQALQWQPDLVISISSAGASLLPGRRRPFPVVAQCHGTAWAEVQSSVTTGGIREWMKVLINCARIPREAYAYRRFDRVWAVSKEVRDQLTARPYTTPKSRIGLIPNGIDSLKFTFDADRRESIRAEWGIAHDTSVGVSLSRLHKQKGVDVAIRSLAVPGAAGRLLLVAGGGPERTRLAQLAETLGVADRVRFLGHVEGEEIIDLLCGADALIFPTRRHEGLPLSLLEALAMGLPVLTTAQCNVPDDLRDRVTLTSGSPTDIAHTWPATRNASQRISDLPSQYSARVNGAAYLCEVQALV
ncbi:glycosyltransferase family 4 protein [Rhodococcus koreensis]|uniref:glycosyltransferase family 4 protein n=1 Tax=Rhodococcus koreensis TaxID=99653 RepID=UPI00197E1CA8|nr:glycosyltransferase family 4 protein [Rhodococcus koreensis]QSE87081.1 glycosyltransferase family 4 protein [Rhodococcus koreensis]